MFIPGQPCLEIAPTAASWGSERPLPGPVGANAPLPPRLCSGAPQTGENAIGVAARYGCGGVILVLVGSGVDIETTDYVSRRRSPPQPALVIVRRIIVVTLPRDVSAACFRLNSQCGYAALMRAAMAGDVPALEALVRAGATVNHRQVSEAVRLP